MSVDRTYSFAGGVHDECGADCNKLGGSPCPCSCHDATYIRERAYEVGLPFRSTGELILWLDPFSDHSLLAGIGVEFNGCFYSAAHTREWTLGTIEKRLHLLHRAWQA